MRGCVGRAEQRWEYAISTHILVCDCRVVVWCRGEKFRRGRAIYAVRPRGLRQRCCSIVSTSDKEFFHLSPRFIDDPRKPFTIKSSNM